MNMSGKEAIEMLVKRVEWLNSKAAERRKANRPYKLFEKEAAAANMALDVLKMMRELNIQHNGHGKEALKKMLSPEFEI